MCLLGSLKKMGYVWENNTMSCCLHRTCINMPSLWPTFIKILWKQSVIEIFLQTENSCWPMLSKIKYWPSTDFKLVKCLISKGCVQLFSNTWHLYESFVEKDEWVSYASWSQYRLYCYHPFHKSIMEQFQMYGEPSYGDRLYILLSYVWWYVSHCVTWTIK